MNTISAVKNAQHAAWYHEQSDDYYAENGKATSAWHGKLAAQVGNVGRVNRDVFADALSGRTPDGNHLGRWGKNADGETEWQHRPGYDSTFSADKSVSIMALVADDDRIIQAHDEAVNEALKLVESRITTRIRNLDGSITYENTGAMAAALYRHETSRNQDAQLHTHSIINNITKCADSKWRSIEPRSLYAAQKEAGELYQQVLSQKLRELGYNVEKITTERGLNYVRIKDAPADLVDLHSSRRKEIKQALQEAGLDEGATRSQRQTATLTTRKTKEAADHYDLKTAWQKQAENDGHDLDAIVETAKNNARQIDGAALETKQADASEQAVDFAINHLSERDARFSHDDLKMQATRYAIGTDATQDGIDTAIKTKVENNELYARQTVGRDRATMETKQRNGWTTDQGIKAERAFLSIEKQGRNAVEPILNNEDAKAAVDAASAASDQSFNRGQRAATEGLLTSTNRITALQGFAGTAKTSSVVSTYAATAEANGYSVRGMAPTSRATEELESAGISQTENTAKLLARVKGQPDDIKKNEVWLVDEASLMSASDTRDLTRAAEQYDARLVMIGDVEQIGSIQAGESYRQLQNNGMETHTLDEIVRQNNEAARQAVKSSIESDYQNALVSIDRSGHVAEYAPDENKTDRDEARAEANSQRLENMANEYLNLEASERERTLVIDPSREGREALNEQIRDGLKSEGTIDGEREIRFTALEKQDKTEAEAKDYRNYSDGDVLRFSKDRKKDGIEKDKEYEVIGRDKFTERVELKDRETGDQKSFAPNNTSPKRLQSYEETDIVLAPGDRIRHTENNKGRGHVNGQRGTVKDVDYERGTATIATDRGQTYELDARKSGDKTIRHDYAGTAHAAQGQTADRVIAHADSERKNLIDQRSFYVQVSRAREQISIYTDDREQLQEALDERSGIKEQALDDAEERQRDPEPQADAQRDTTERDKTAENDKEEKQEAEAEKSDEHSADTSANRESDRGAGQGQNREFQPESGLKQQQQQREHQQEQDHDQGLDFSV